MAEPDPRATNAPEFTVSELSNTLKRAIEDRFGYVRVRGEVSGYRGPHSSGHAYFSLKDDKARLDAVVWRTSFQRMRVKPEEGLEVVATGRLTTFPGKSSYQIVIEFAGTGRRRRADGAARGAPQEARRGRAVRRRPKAQGSVSAEGRRGRDLADRRGHPRHSAPARRPLSGQGRRLAGARSGRDLGGRGRRRDRGLQRAWPGGAPRRVRTC